MNNLVSNNPILRFKLGKKIIKAYGGYYFPVNNNGIIYEYNPYKSAIRYSEQNVELPSKRALEIQDFFNKQYQRLGSGNDAVYRKAGTNHQWTNYEGKLVDRTPEAARLKMDAAREAYRRKQAADAGKKEAKKKQLSDTPDKTNNPPVDNAYTSKYRNNDDIKAWVQSQGGVRAALNILGFTEGHGLDGIWGDKTQAAYEDWLKAYLLFKPDTLLEDQTVLKNAVEPLYEESNLSENNFVPYDKSMTRDIIKAVTGKNAHFNFRGDQRKAIKEYLNGADWDDTTMGAFSLWKSLFDNYRKGNNLPPVANLEIDLIDKEKLPKIGILPGIKKPENLELDYLGKNAPKEYLRLINSFYRKQGGNIMLESRNPIERFKLGRKILFAYGGAEVNKKRTTPIKRFVVEASDNSIVREFDTYEDANKFRKSLGIPARITDLKGASYNSTLKTNVTKGKDAKRTAYDRQEAEKPYNNLSFREAYKKALSSGNAYFGYQGKAYKTDLKNANDNTTLMEAIYGNNLGWDSHPKLLNKLSREARKNYRSKIKSIDNTRPVKPLETNSSANEKADKYAKLTWDETKFVDLIANPIGVGLNVALKGIDPENYHGEIYRSGLNPLGYAQDISEGNIKGLFTRALDLTGYFGLPGASQLVTKIAPKIPLSTYLPQVYEGGKGATNFVINGLNRARGKTTNFFRRLVPTHKSGLYGKYSIEAADHIDPSVTAAVSNGTRTYVTGNPNSVLPMYTYFGDAVIDPRTWTTLDVINQLGQNEYE